MIAALKGKSVSGAAAICQGAMDHCQRILHKSNDRKFIAEVSLAVSPVEIVTQSLLRVIPSIIWSLIVGKIRGMILGVAVAFTEIDDNACKFVFCEYLSKALEAGDFVPTPEPQVVGHGLQSIQDALNLQKRGVSAKKIVVTL